MKTTILLMILIGLTGVNAFALEKKRDLPDGLYRKCGTITALERDTTHNHVTLDGKKLELLMAITSGPADFTLELSIEKETLKDEYMKSLILDSLGKEVCINYTQDNRFWVQAMRLMPLK